GGDGPLDQRRFRGDLDGEAGGQREDVAVEFDLVGFGRGAVGGGEGGEQGEGGQQDGEAADERRSVRRWGSGHDRGRGPRRQCPGAQRGGERLLQQQLLTAPRPESS